MFNYLFTIGSHPQLSEAEIRHVVPGTIQGIVSSKEMIFASDQELDCQALIQRLGGTVKISEAVMELDDLTHDLVRHLQTLQPEGKITFSLSANDARNTGLAIKKALKAEGRQVRFVEANNTATILHNKLVDSQTDFTVVRGVLYVTRAIQPIEELGRRDYGRPGHDDKSGMVPPKLAKMMLNFTGIEPGGTEVIMDPFCGSGTVLMEALHMGYKYLQGTDLSEKAVEDTKMNLVWMEETLGVPGPERLTLLDTNVRELFKYFKKNSVDALVFEPYMGKPLHGDETREELDVQMEELRELYLDAFEQFHRILKPGGVIVGILPAFKSQEQWLHIAKQTRIKNIGFEPSYLLDKWTSLKYHRSGQHIARHVSKWKKV